MDLKSALTVTFCTDCKMSASLAKLMNFSYCKTRASEMKRQKVDADCCMSDCFPKLIRPVYVDDSFGIEHSGAEACA